MDESVDTDERLGSRQLEVREVAARLFYERGFNGTSLKEIANELGLRAPSLYNHISSKQQLLQDLMFDNTLTLRSAVDGAIASANNVSDQLRLAVEALILHAARHRFQVHVSMFEMPCVEEPARSQLMRLRSENGTRWRKLVERGVKEGVFQTEHPEIAAMSIVDLGAGVARWYRPNEKLSDEQLAEFYGNLALRIVGAKPKAPRSRK